MAENWQVAEENRPSRSELVAHSPAALLPTMQGCHMPLLGQGYRERQGGSNTSEQIRKGCSGVQGDEELSSISGTLDRACC